MEGLAHFVEHLLFLGSELHPDENFYRDLTDSNAGFSNAYTDYDRTTFFHTIDTKHFKESILAY